MVLFCYEEWFISTRKSTKRALALGSHVYENFLRGEQQWFSNIDIEGAFLTKNDSFNAHQNKKFR